MVRPRLLLLRRPSLVNVQNCVGIASDGGRRVSRSGFGDSLDALGRSDRRAGVVHSARFHVRFIFAYTDRVFNVPDAVLREAVSQGWNRSDADIPAAIDQRSFAAWQRVEIERRDWWS